MWIVGVVCIQVLAAVQPKVRVIGCQPANSCVMMQCVCAGRILDLPSTHTLSDGTAGACFSQPGVIKTQMHCNS